MRPRHSLGRILKQTMTDCTNALKEWTGKASATIIYDSTVDEFTDEWLFNKVKGKRNIAIIGFTIDGDVFGGFHSVAVTKQNVRFYDPNIFAFSFESHGRCMTPQKFSVCDGLKKKAYVCLGSYISGDFYGFWVEGYGCFRLGNERSESCCWDMSFAFEGLNDTTLTGNNGGCGGPFHHCTRLVAIQLQ